MRGHKSIVREYIESLALALLLAFFLKTSVVEAYKIPSGSMEDTLLIGDFLLANKFIFGARLPLINLRLPAVRQPRSGDVVIFKFPHDRKTNYIKRCIATEGQVVEIQDKVVYVDGHALSSPTKAKHTDKRIQSNGKRDNYGPVKVPKGHMFVMGDNRDNSFDSRFWGFLSKDLLLGEAMVIHWSWRPDPNAPPLSLNNPLSVLKLMAHNIVHFAHRVRWRRIGDIVR